MVSVAHGGYYAGCVGIGTTSPARDLSIVGSGANALLQIANCDTGSTSDNGLEIFMSSNSAGIVNRESGYLRFDTDNCERMRITACGCVGINCTGPGRTLDISGDAQVSTNLIVGTALYTNDWTAGTAATQYIKNSSGSTSIAIQNGGNVGIGTTAPGEKLTVQGNISAQGDIKLINTNPWIRLQTADASEKRLDLCVDCNSVGIIAANQSAQQLAFCTAGAEAVRVDAAGCVGIGDTTPSQKLDVAGAVNIQDGYTLRYNNSSNISILGSSSTGLTYTSLEHHFKAYDGSSSYPEYMTIDTGGNVGIGTDNPPSKLTVAGDTTITGNFICYRRCNLLGYCNCCYFSIICN